MRTDAFTWNALRRVATAALLLGLLGALGCSGGGSGSEAVSGPSPDPTPAPDPSPGGAAVSLAWDRPTLGEDGSALNDLAGFKIYDGVSPGDYVAVTDVGNVKAFTTDPYPIGTYYFSVTAYDSSGNESTFSNEVVVTISEDP